MNTLRSRLRMLGLAACSSLMLGGCGSNITHSDTQGDCAQVDPRTDDFHQQVELSTTTADGLRYGDITNGSDPRAASGQHIIVQYTGWLQDGTRFDSTRKPGGAPYPFTLGAGGVIRGWREGIPGMKLGGVRRLVIPAALAYGADGYPHLVPANATLTYDVQLLCIG